MSLSKFSYFALVRLLTAEQSSLTGTAGLNPLDSVLSLLTPIVLLVFILFLAFKSTQLIKRKYDMQGSPGSKIEILERTVLGPDKYLMVVRLRDTVLLLGVASGQINKLAELDAMLYKDVSPALGGGESFAALFKDTLDKGLGGILGDKKE